MFLEKLDTSFLLFVENQLQKAGFFSNHSGEILYPINNNRAKPSSTFSSSFGGFVYDSSILGATVVTSVVSSGSVISGANIDYINGIVKTPSGFNQVSGNFSHRTLPISIVPEINKKLLLQTRWRGDKSEWGNSPSGVSMNQKLAPCVFLSYVSSRNDPFELGGMDQTTRVVKAVVLTDNGADLTRAEQVFTDMARRNFMMIDQPFAFGGGFKSGVFNYDDAVSAAFDYTKMVHIEESYFNKFGALSESDFNNNAVLGFAELYLKIPRMTRND